jgi:hypothetical protein
MSLLLLNSGGASFRSIGKIIVSINLCFNLKLRIPAHTTVLIWMKKQGLQNFEKKCFYASEKWILIIDESVQFGNKKLLVALAIRESTIKIRRALTYQDLIPLTISASDSWKAEEIEKEIRSRIDLSQISYVVSDCGNNLKSSYYLMGLTHIEDVGHKFSWFIKEVFEKQEKFEGYTKHLSGLRGKLSLSKFAHIIPPNQRTISRFMNLTPLFKWGIKILKLLDTNKLKEEEVEKVKFVLDYKEFILDMHSLLGVMNAIQKKLKAKQLSILTERECAIKLKEIRTKDGLRIVEMVKDYLKKTMAKLPKENPILCSSDIIESCFGKYKEVVKANKSVGITDLCLSISCLTTKDSFEQTKNMLETVKVKQIVQWKKENIGESLLSKRNNLFRKIG